MSADSLSSLAAPLGMSAATLEGLLSDRLTFMGDAYAGYDYNEWSNRDIFHKRRAQFKIAGDECVARLGHSHGAPFIDCAMAVLRQQRRTSKDHSDPFPVPELLSRLPFRYAEVRHDAALHGLMFNRLVRDYTCARWQDGSSPTLLTRTWSLPVDETCSSSSTASTAYITAAPAGTEKVDRANAAASAPALEYVVDVLNEDPLIAVAHGFLTPMECELLQQKAVYKHGCTGCDCKSDLFLDGDEGSAALTRFASRQTAFVRSLTGYDVTALGAEPIRQSLYDNEGECSIHCDGECYGAPHPPECEGTRVATTVAYCEVAELGGQTSFPRGGVIVQPQVGDLVLFGYLRANRTMDSGYSEHSGCPVYKGRKSIATTWHREVRPVPVR